MSFWGLIELEDDTAEPKDEIEVKVAKAKQRDVGRSIIRLDSDTFQHLKVRTGDIVKIKGKGRVTAAIVWPAYKEDERMGIIRMDGRLRKNVGVSIGERVHIQKALEKPAREVLLAPTNVRITSGDPYVESFIKRKLLNYPLTQGDVIYIPIGIAREVPFQIIGTKPKGIVVVKQKTMLRVSEQAKDEIPGGIPVITYEDVGGLKAEIQRIREMVELPLKHPELFKKLGIDPPKGVLLRGPPGCGKTLLVKAVANESDAFFKPINGPEVMSKFYGESEKRLRTLFDDAEKRSPSIVFIDELDAIAPKREEVTGEVERRVVAQLLALMDGLKARGKVVIIGATNRANALDPALRRPGRFDREIEIGVPDKNGRKEILQIHSRGMPLTDDVDLTLLANITHGYVGADLAALSREAAMKALRRYLPKINIEEEEIPPEILDQIEVRMEDFLSALKEISPSAIREVLIEIPNVHWSDVGGLESVKQELREAVEWPLKDQESFKRMGITPPKGVLLVGPPGCGKTLLAKAIATESEANFISIKGPEVLSKWVGESEKAVREVFRKARQASPAIVFFDEIDAIAPKRGMTHDSNVTARVISQLLTEMDGLETLRDVVVIAATNRPDIIDRALLRVGRFDRIIYVGAPDLESRLKIFELYTVNMPLAEDVNLDYLARMTKDFAGSDIEGACNEAALLALREDRAADIVYLHHFETAIKQIHPTILPDVRAFYKKSMEKLKKPPTEASSHYG
ncbi:MAG: CDC48 family AAA ATPase [Candidatus Helarchaeota archaeon]|nr:CDC48 family AAA ATPase [Candidatus Helarchaeota archaeon]